MPMNIYPCFYFILILRLTKDEGVRDKEHKSSKKHKEKDRERSDKGRPQTYNKNYIVFLLTVKEIIFLLHIWIE